MAPEAKSRKLKLAQTRVNHGFQLQSCTKKGNGAGHFGKLLLMELMGLVEKYGVVR